MFCDVVGSTPLGERLDPESVRRVMTRFFERMRAVLERHGGTVEKYIGDAVMAVFGVPELHEDDALRAVRAASEMRDALVELNAELEPAWGVSLQTRIGVNTGEVVVGDQRGGPLVDGRCRERRRPPRAGRGRPGRDPAGRLDLRPRPRRRHGRRGSGARR